MKQASDIRKQLTDYCATVGIPSQSCGDNERIKKCFACGFFLQAAARQEDGQYKTLVGNKIVSIHPSSVMFSRKPPYVLYHQLVFTKRKYMRGILSINPNWLTDKDVVGKFYQKRAIS